MKRFVSWMSKSGRRQSDNSSDDAGSNLPRGVQRVYMMEKDAGHRGPIVGAFLVDVLTEEQVVVIVTPSGVSVMTTEEGRSIAYRRPDSGDAYTACALIPISTKLNENDIITKNCGLVLGTQDGRLELLEVSSSDLKLLHQCHEKTSCVTAIERLRCVPSVVAVGTVDGRLLLWDPVVHPFTPTVSLRVKDQAAIQSISSVGESEIWISTTACNIHVFSVAVENFTKVRTVTCAPSNSLDLDIPISDMVESRSQNLLICLSSGSEIVLVDVVTKKILHRYPARLMSCGAAVTSITAFDDDESTFIILGGVEGSLCVRELNRRRNDNKLQCLLLRCFDKLVPEKNDQVDIPEGCPVSSLSIAPGDLCIVGDAACSVFVINLSLHQWRAATSGNADEVLEENEGTEIESREETREPSSEDKEEEVLSAPVVEEPVRQRSIELPIETRQIPKREEPEKEKISPEDAEIFEEPVKKDDSPKITVVSPKSLRAASADASPASRGVVIAESSKSSPKSLSESSPGRDIDSPSKAEENFEKDSNHEEGIDEKEDADLSPQKSENESPKSIEKSPSSPSHSPKGESMESPKQGDSPVVSPKKSSQSQASPKSHVSSPKSAPQLEESFSDEGNSESPKTRKQSDL